MTTDEIITKLNVAKVWGYYEALTDQTIQRLRELEAERTEMLEAFKRLREAETINGHTMRETAETLGISATTWSSWTCKDVGAPDFYD
jgi:hypothetical protein